MDYVKTYGNLIKKTMDGHPVAARRMVNFGLAEESFRIGHFPPKEMPQALKVLDSQSLANVNAALKNPQSSCWTNIFAPVELMQCFDLRCVSMECLASFLSGFKIEDALVNEAEAEGIAPTLCSYHKSFIGGTGSSILPDARLYVTTSLACDGNINTFRYVGERRGVPGFVIDIPDQYSQEALDYLVAQERELIGFLQERTGVRFDIDRLRETIRRENASRACYRRYLGEIRHRYYPKTLTLEMFLLFATHLDIGTKQTLDFFRLLEEDVKKYPERKGKAIFWVHMLPYYQQTLQEYMNYKEDYYIQACDMNLDYMEKMDADHPLQALARKMILNTYNGSYDRKIRNVARMVSYLGSDAVINFCHWGCKQSSGGVMLLKEEMRKRGIPMLVLDGDALDRRNSHDGQIRTRLEAFLEMIDTMGESK